jgi:hypothetical protein
MKMSRTVHLVFMAAATVSLVLACGGKKDHDEEGSSWEAMDAYHFVMAEAFHPLKDSADLAPAKANAEALAAEAEKWAAQPLPERVNNDEMTTRLENLKRSSRAFADKVKAGAPDEELSEALTSLHDEFHHIMETWEGGHNKHH